MASTFSGTARTTAHPRFFLWKLLGKLWWGFFPAIFLGWEYLILPTMRPIWKYLLRPVVAPVGRYLLYPVWLLIWRYVLYPVMQPIVICLFLLYSIWAYTVRNELVIIGIEYLKTLRDKGDLLASWHETMCDSFLIGAAIKIAVGLKLFWQHKRIPWNFAAAENFMSLWWARITLRMLKTHGVKKSATGIRADGSALRQSIKLLRTANVVLFPGGGRFKPGQTEDPQAPAGFGLSVLNAQRVIPIAFVGMGGTDGLQPYRKTSADGPPTSYARFGKYIDWIFGIRFGLRVTMIVGEPIEVAWLEQQFGHLPDAKQQVADYVMQRICELRRQILHLDVNHSRLALRAVQSAA